MKRALVLGLALLATGAARARAQHSPWTQVEVRKAFDGGKSETEPASFGLIAPGKSASAYWLVDAGLRLKPQETLFNKSGTFELVWYPSIEWHHLNAEPLNKQDAKHQVGPGINAELWFPQFGSTELHAYVLGKAALTRDILNETTQDSVTALVGFVQSVAAAPTGIGWEGGFRPGAELTSNGHRRLHYYPYVGIEHYHKLAITAKQTVVAPIFEGALLLVRVQAEAYPFHEQVIPGRIPFAVSVEYAYRRLLSNQSALESPNLNMLSLSATWYFVAPQKVGVGLATDIGQAPSTNFASQQRTVLALRLKL